MSPRKAAEVKQTCLDSQVEATTLVAALLGASEPLPNLPQLAGKDLAPVGILSAALNRHNRFYTNQKLGGSFAQVWLTTTSTAALYWHTAILSSKLCPQQFTKQ